MTLTIELTPEQEERLSTLARREGISPEGALQRLVEAHLPPLSSPAPLPEGERARREKVMRELVEETERLGLYK